MVMSEDDRIDELIQACSHPQPTVSDGTLHYYFITRVRVILLNNFFLINMLMYLRKEGSVGDKNIGCDSSA